MIQLDNSHKGTFVTIILASFGWLDVNLISQIVFMSATIVTATLTSIYTIKKIKKLNNEKDSEKY
jgi:hypothetical protein